MTQKLVKIQITQVFESDKNIKALFECMELKEYILYDFVPEFSEVRQSDEL